MSKAVLPPLLYRYTTRVRTGRTPRQPEIEAILAGVRRGDLDALVFDGPWGRRVYTLQSPDAPYRALVEAMNEGAVALLPDGTVLYCNQRFAGLVATPIEQVIGASFSQLVDPDDRPAFVAALAESVTGACARICRLLRSDGGPVSARLSLRGLPDVSPPAVCMVVTDLTEHEQTHARLQLALSEKEVLLKEIHHRVKNNLQLIASLLRMQSRSTPEGPWHDHLDECQHRIKAMALVHEQLYAASDIARIEAAVYLHALTAGIMRAYAASAASISLLCKIDEPMSLSTNSAVPLGLIVTELVSNSLKYAFPEGRSGLIQVDLQQLSSEFVLTVQDNGVGLPATVDPRHSPSLGLRIVRSLTQQLGGTLSVDRSQGTVFRIVLPIQLVAGPFE